MLFIFPEYYLHSGGGISTYYEQYIQVITHINNEFNPDYIHNFFLNTIMDKSAAHG